MEDLARELLAALDELLTSGLREEIAGWDYEATLYRLDCLRTKAHALLNEPMDAGDVAWESLKPTTAPLTLLLGGRIWQVTSAGKITLKDDTDGE